MKEQNVRFFLTPNNFEGHRSHSGMHHSTCARVLNKAFGLHDWYMMFNTFEGGFWVVCTADQFARFIIHRNDMGDCVNRIKELQPVLCEPVVDLYTHLATVTGVQRDCVKRVALALDYTDPNAPPANQIDVSRED